MYKDMPEEADVEAAGTGRKLLQTERAAAEGARGPQTSPVAADSDQDMVQ